MYNNIFNKNYFGAQVLTYFGFSDIQKYCAHNTHLDYSFSGAEMPLLMIMIDYSW